jgi:beta-lactamase class A
MTEVKRCLVKSGNDQNVGERMKSKILWRILGSLSIFFVLCSLIIAFVEYRNFIQQPTTFPTGSRIAGVPVGGLDEEAALTRIKAFYGMPLILQVNGDKVHADPGVLGFSMGAGAMAAQAIGEQQGRSYWDYLWGRGDQSPIDVPLDADVDEEQIRSYLSEEIAPRYTQKALPERPIPFTTNFEDGHPGQQLDFESAVVEITTALLSSDVHRATIGIIEDAETHVTFTELEAFLQHNINFMGFEGLVEVYLESMDTGETLHFAVQDGTAIDPDVAFTAASTIKIPIMISVLRRLSEPTPDFVIIYLEQMIALSENTPADTLMQTYLDEVRGPLIVSEDMAALGLENTFLGAYLYLGAPPLQTFKTPANSRTDINLDPDNLSQTVSSEAGQLLSAIYTCAVDGSGLLTETFPGEITQTECQLMVDALSANQIGVLIEAGVPAEATVAHKHGWATELDGLLHSMSDVAIVYTQGGDYVLNIFIYDAVRLDYEEGNRLLARLSQTVYNFFNIERQVYWWFD